MTSITVQQKNPIAVFMYALKAAESRRQYPRSCGLSLPIELMRKIDSDRKDISRSRFLLRLLERVYSVARIDLKEVSE